MKIAQLVLLASLISTPIYSQEKPKRMVLASPGDSLPMVISANVLKAAYQRLGIELEFVDLPPKRSLLQSNREKYDGEVSRVWAITNEFPNLVRIPTPINYIEQVLYSTRKLDVTSCEGLANFSFGIRRGVKHAEDCSVHARKVLMFNDSDQMMKVLNAERIDFVINARLHGLSYEQNEHFPKIMLIEPPLKRINLYHYLHNSNTMLVDELDNVFSAMDKSGELEAIRAQTVLEHNSSAVK